MKRAHEEVLTINGHKVKGFKDDFITNRIKSQGLYEKLTLDFLRGYLAARFTKPVILDIGANIGNHTLDFSTYAGKVFSFEPIDFVYELLQNNIVANNIENVTTVKKALSDKPGSDMIHLNTANLGASSITFTQGSDLSVEIEKITGDDFIKAEGITSVDFIKMDVEGHEKYALQGLFQTIEKYKPLIMMEWHDRVACREFNSEGMLGRLQEMYDIKVIGTNRDPGYWVNKPAGKVRRKLTKIFRKRVARLYDFDESKTYNNILFIPKSV